MNRYSSEKSLRQSLVLSHLLTSFIPLGFIAAFILLFIIRSVEEDFSVKINMLSQGARGQIQLFMGRPLTAMNIIAAIIEEVGPDREAVDRVLNTHLVDSVYFDTIYLLDADGIVIHAALSGEREQYRAELLGINLGHKTEFKNVRRTGRPQWSDTFLSLSSGKISLTLYTPAGANVLAADIKLGALAQLITKLSSDNVVATVIDRNGAIIIHPDPALTGSSIMMNDIELVVAALNGTESVAEFEFRGERYLGATSIIEPTGWVCLFAEPTAHMSRRLQIPLLIFAAGLFGAVVLSIFLALYRVRTLARPITEMTEQSAVIARGEDAQALPRGDIKELGQLAESINYMAMSIRKRERQLRDNELKYRELVENTSNLVLRIDNDWHITYVNHTIEQLTGMEAEQAMGQSFAVFFTEADWRQLTDAFAGWSSAQVSSGTIEARLQHRDGQASTLLLTANLHYDSRQRLRDINIIGHDISARLEFETKQRELERQRQQSQKMELLGLMAGGVAHDLNNILAGIVSYPELLLHQLDEDSPLRPGVEAIKQSGDRAAAVVADLLTIARGSAAVHKVCDLNQLVENYCASPAFENLKGHFPEVQFSVTADTALNRCSCSPIHIEKAIMNLVTNAFEAVGQGGSVELASRNVGASEAAELVPQLPFGPYVSLAVRDSGEGISTDSIERVFEPFFSKKGLGRSGTGLGLTVAWSTVREHGGTITVTSSEAGSEFVIYLPATEAAEDLDQAGEELYGLSGKKEHILVVDDEAQLREIGVQMLELLNYRASAVSSGEEALTFLQEHEVDLVLLDMQMDPGINGRETYERISEINPKQKAIIATGYSTSWEVESTLEMGAGALINKPFSLTELGRAIKEELRTPAEPGCSDENG